MPVHSHLLQPYNHQFSFLFRSIIWRPVRSAGGGILSAAFVVENNSITRNAELQTPYSSAIASARTAAMAGSSGRREGCFCSSAAAFSGVGSAKRVSTASAAGRASSLYPSKNALSLKRQHALPRRGDTPQARGHSPGAGTLPRRGHSPGAGTLPWKVS